ncbi:MAG: carboxylesterase/lipase family protein [Brevundimonas sp.]|nr:MAG: carboxylesterase/lipase family protein [Brevundimonas sp.]
MTLGGLTLGGAAAAGLFPNLAVAQGAAPVVRTTYGPVAGGRDQGVLVFKGVRYGADTSTHRFEAPRAPERWDRPVETVEYGASSPQRGNDANQSEDCLFLNVWTPAADGEKRPVMFYIHGGAYSGGSGSSPLTDGTNLAKRGDVVVVSINHRLNLFGYAYLDRLASGFDVSGNAGQLDIVLALQWVKDNIAAFGGDPERVMVFGQSGGGAKIATLMATPVADGMFHRAVSMSGQQYTASGPMNATKRTVAWLKTLGLTEAQAGQVKTMPAAQLLEAMGNTEDPVLGYGGLYFGPVMDNKVLFRHPFYPDAAPQGVPVPFIIGNCHDETLAFMGGDPANRNLTWETLPGRMGYSALRIDVAPEVVIEAYRKMKPDWTPDQVLIGATTAGRSWRAAVMEAEARAETTNPAWVYQLDFPTVRADGQAGAGHGSDIPLVFDTMEAGRRGGPESPGAAEMVRQMSETFVAFAKTGDPNNAAIPRWDKYELPRRQTMVFNRTSAMADDPRGDERKFFAGIPYTQPGT